MIKFSIIIPAYKGHFLQKAINSCLCQSYSFFELIIVDDASPENLQQIVDTFQDDRIHFYRNKKNCGAINVVDNWNICLSFCTGDYVICMGDDDMLLPHTLEEYLKTISKYPKLGVYHAMTQMINENDQVVEIQSSRPDFEYPMAVCYSRWAFKRKQYIGDWLFDIKLLRSVGGFYKLPLAWGSDDVTVLILSALGNRGVANTQTICFQYRVSDLTISSNSSNVELKLQARKQFELWCDKFVEQEKTICKSYEEKVYIDLWYKNYTDFYRRAKKIDITNDLITHPVRVVKWLLKCKYFQVTRIDVIDSFYNALKEIIYKKTNKL